MNEIFYRASGARVEIGRYALQKLHSFRQLDMDASEAGGVLLGRYVLGSDDVVIDDITTPFPEDERGRFSFRRSQKPHQAAIDAQWESSGGRSHYLGEWHTHPEPYPHPSGTDTSDWKRRVKTDTYDAESLLFIIVGTRTLRVWEGRRSGPRCWRAATIKSLKADAALAR